MRPAFLNVFTRAGLPAPGLLLVLLMLFVLVAGGCDSNDEASSGTVTVVMTHVVDGEPLVFDDERYTNAAGNPYGVTLLEYILTDVALQTAGGGSVPLAEVQYVNAEEPATQTFSTASVPGGAYTGITFTFGIDGATNTTGGLPNTAPFNNMAWPEQMGGGYHYMRLEGRYQGDSGEAAFLTHTGPTMGEDYSIEVTLPLAFQVDGGETMVEIVMNLNEWFTDPNLYDFRDYGGIMGDATAQNLLRANGVDVFSAGIRLTAE